MTMTTINRVAVYARVSTKDQTAENQLRDLREYCRDRGWPIVAEYVDHGVSGATADRIELKSCMEAARRRKFDVLLVWRYDRFARSISHLVSTLDELRDIGVGFVSLKESTDTSTAQGRLVFGILASLAEFERELIRERIYSGLRRAKEQGIELGRPNLDIGKVNEILALGQGSQRLSQREIAVRVGVGKGTVYRVLKQAPQNQGQFVALFPDDDPVAFSSPH